MARLTGPDEAVRTVYLTSGINAGKAAAQGFSVPLYADSALTTPADVQTLGGVAIPGSPPHVTVDAYSQIPQFLFPNNVDTVWTSINGGPAVPLYARTDDRLDALGAAVAAAQSTANLGALATQSKAASFTAVAQFFYLVDATAGTVVATLPAANVAGQVVAVKRVAGSNPVTVARSGSDTIGAAATTADITLDNEVWKLVSSGSGQWNLLSGNKSLGSLDARYVQPSMVDAKGDLLVGTADNVLARLALGADGQSVRADSAQSAGIKWVTPADVQGGTTSGTWANPSPSIAKPMLIFGFSAGSGGGTGRRGAAGSLRTAGAGGAPGVPFMAWALTTDFPATVAYTVGAGGSGGTAPTTDDTDGNPGSTGGNAFFGASSTTYRIGGINNSALGGGRSGNSAAAAAAGQSAVGGPAGGQSSASGAAGSAGGPVAFTSTSALQGATGGAGGGGVSSGNADAIGGVGGNWGAGTATGGTTGAIGGGNAGAGSAGTGLSGGLGGGGGGGNAAGGGGRGGDGGFPGGGGGGAGAGLNGTTGQPGGKGGDGLIRIITFL